MGTVDIESRTTVNLLTRQEQVDLSYAIALGSSDAAARTAFSSPPFEQIAPDLFRAGPKAHGLVSSWKFSASGPGKKIYFASQKAEPVPSSSRFFWTIPALATAERRGLIAAMERWKTTMRELSAEVRLHLYARSLSRRGRSRIVALYGAFAVIAAIVFATLSVHPF